MATFEEATHCPKCGEPGREVTHRAGPQRSTVYVYRCENKACKWNQQPGGWVVMQRADGSIPDAQTVRPKVFPKASADQEAFARRMMEDAAFHDPSLADAVRRHIEESD